MSRRLISPAVITPELFCKGLVSLLRFPLLALLCWTAIGAWAQNERADRTWDEVWQELMNEEESEDEAGNSDTYELLQQLADHPIDLNHATRDELEQLPFLSSQQVMDLTEYLGRYGPMRSLSELRMVRSMDYWQLQLLPFFVYAGEVTDSLRFPPLKTIVQYGRHELTAAVRLPFYERQGDRNGYLGYRYRHWLRYEFSYGKNVRLGLVGAQDAGEPFFSGGNRWGYDAYSYYLQVSRWGVVETAIVGKYKLSSAMGLVLNNSFSLGKQASLQSLGRQTSTLRVHATRSESDYFQGAAATLMPVKALRLTLFASYRPLDATLNEDLTARTLITDGYHRTPTEMEKKYNTHQTAAGAVVSYRQNGWHAGFTTVYSHLDRRLSPDIRQLYRRYQASGSDFVNASIDYGFDHYRFTVSGETAISGHGAVATLNTLSYQPFSRLSLLALQRFYSYRYTTLHGHAFSEGGHVQNESGLYLGATWQPFANWHLTAYADWAYFPWARYRVSQSSSAQDYLGEVCYQKENWSLKARYRLHRRQLDNSDKTALRRHDEQRTRLVFSCNNEYGWDFALQADGVLADNEDSSRGWLTGGRVGWKRDFWQLNLLAAYFDTDSYDSRICIYERQLPHEFSFPTYYGRGLRLAFMGRADIGSRLRLLARLGHTHYFDRSTIGTGLQQIEAAHQSDLDLQLRWRL